MKRIIKKQPRRAAVVLRSVHAAIEPYAHVITECLHFCRTAADEAGRTPAKRAARTKR